MNTPGPSLPLGLVSQIFANISPRDVKRALEFQAHHPDTRLGQAMVKCGMLAPDTLNNLLHKQEELRQAPAVNDVLRVVDYATERTRGVAKLMGQLQGSTAPKVK